MTNVLTDAEIVQAKCGVLYPPDVALTYGVDDMDRRIAQAQHDKDAERIGELERALADVDIYLYNMESSVRSLRMVHAGVQLWREKIKRTLRVLDLPSPLDIPAKSAP